MTMNKVNSNQVIENTRKGFDMLEFDLRQGEYNKADLAKNLNYFLYENTVQITMSGMNSEEKRKIMNYRSSRILEIINYIDSYNDDYGF